MSDPTETASMVPLEPIDEGATTQEGGQPAAKSKYDRVYEAVKGNLTLSMLDGMRSQVFRAAQTMKDLNILLAAEPDATKDVLFGMFFACGQMRTAINQLYGQGRAEGEIFPHLPDPEIEAANRKDMPF